MAIYKHRVYKENVGGAWLNSGTTHVDVTNLARVARRFGNDRHTMNEITFVHATLHQAIQAFFMYVYFGALAMQQLLDAGQQRRQGRRPCIAGLLSTFQHTAALQYHQARPLQAASGSACNIIIADLN